MLVSRAGMQLVTITLHFSGEMLACLESCGATTESQGNKPICLDSGGNMPLTQGSIVGYDLARMTFSIHHVDARY